MLLWPPECAVCHVALQQPHGICAQCWQGIEFIRPPFCRSCGLPFPFGEDQGICEICLSNPLQLDGLRSAVFYEKGIRALLLHFKYGDYLELLPFFQNLLRRHDYTAQQFDMISFVPMHWRRYRRRFYNQSAVLANIVAQDMKLPVVPLLWRNRLVLQKGQGRQQRRRYIKGIFQLSAAKQSYVKGKRILLVDDVYTTGATLNECARTLKAAGAQSVHALTLARTFYLS